MTVINEKFTIVSSGNNSLTDITEKVKGAVQNCAEQNAIVNIFTTSPYCSIVTLDYEKGLEKDFIRQVENIIPINWKQNNYSNDDGAHSHIRASILGHSLSLSIFEKQLQLAQYQRIIIADFNHTSSNIEIIISLTV